MPICLFSYLGQISLDAHKHATDSLPACHEQPAENLQQLDKYQQYRKYAQDFKELSNPATVRMKQFKMRRINNQD